MLLKTFLARAKDGDPPAETGGAPHHANAWRLPTIAGG
jgi:hypothetical protein